MGLGCGHIRPQGQATDHRSMLVIGAVTAGSVNGDWDKPVLSAEGVFPAPRLQTWREGTWSFLHDGP